MERDLQRCNFKIFICYFNSHAHVERDPLPVPLCLSFQISTHTLTWSVTEFLVTRNENIGFQLTRSRGAWRKSKSYKYLQSDFNSHAHVERDNRQSKAICNGFISTHTLTWSVTDCFDLKCSLMLFQLTRSRGAWLPLLIFNPVRVNFNSHAHVERDLSLSRIIDDKSYFNSHAHVERDIANPILGSKIVISTHTLTWSVTHQLKCFIILQIFQLTRSRGAWHRYFIMIKRYIIISTHTLTWSVTDCFDLKCSLMLFQLTRSRGAWLPLLIFNPVRVNFNSHAHVERDKTLPFHIPRYRNFNSHAHVERD